MQNPDHQKAKCGKCKAGRGMPCRNTDGSISEHVHHGRPHWSAIVDRKPFKLKGASSGFELEMESLVEFTFVVDLVADLADRRLQPDDDRPVLFGRSDICIDCGDPYSQLGLVERCRERHDVQPPPKPKYRWRRK